MKRKHLTRRDRAAIADSVPFDMYPRVLVGKPTRKQRERSWAYARMVELALKEEDEKP